MKAVCEIESCIDRRMEFLEALIIIRSYQDMVAVDPIKLKQENDALSLGEKESIMQVLRTLRVDEVFKKQLHKVAMKTFKRIEPKFCCRGEPLGNTKDIVSDYNSFFLLMKERNILQFLGHIFDSRVYNQTTVVYVLIEVLFKFLRIKCLAFIEANIKTPRPDPLNVNGSPALTNKNRAKQCSRTSSHLKSMPARGERLKNSPSDKSQQSFEVNCQTIPTEMNPRPPEKPPARPRSSSASKNNSRESRDSRESPAHSKNKRRVIKSYKFIQEETNQRIQLNKMMFMENSHNSQMYLRTFMQMFEQEWSCYLELVGLGKSSEGFKVSSRKKAEWLGKNGEKVAVEACFRNDSIRKDMEQYAQSYSTKH